VSGSRTPLAPLADKVDLAIARRETVAILRRMADLIEVSAENPGYVTYAEVRRLRERAARLRAELRWWPR
jgi:hypothetical protein